MGVIIPASPKFSEIKPVQKLSASQMQNFEIITTHHSLDTLENFLKHSVLAYHSHTQIEKHEWMLWREKGR